MKFAMLSLAIAALTATSLCVALEPENIPVGIQPDGRVLVPTNQMLKPAGKQLTFPGRPVDLQFSSDGATLIVKNSGDLIFIDLKETKISATLPLGGKQIGESVVQGKIYEGMSVTGLQNTGDTIYVTDADNSVRIAKRGADGAFTWSKPIALPAPKVGGKAHPAGLKINDGKLWVTSTRGNCVYCIDINHVAELCLPVGVAPFTVLFTSPTKGYVSNWGGDAPKSADDPQALTSKTPAHIDPRTSVVNDGSVSVITQIKGDWVCSKSIKVGLHPSALIASANGKFLYVANANSDTVSVINTSSDAVVETIACRPEASLPFGSGCDALALSPDGATLYVANASNNCIAVVKLAATVQEAPPPNVGAGAGSTVEGLIPTGWYPGAVLISPDGKKLFVANIKGHGLLAERRAKEKGRGSGDYLGSVSIIDVPDSKQLAEYTKTVNENNRLAQSLSGLEAPRADARPVPVPERHGEPSIFKHVVYVIRENKTYDQVFGDMTEGNGEKTLCIFPEEITPNGHALAREFVLFDNFYCSGAKSPDGHAWVNQAYVTDYLERAYGGFARSYPYEGSDPLAFAATGFLWDNALAHGKTFRNYGEFCKTTYAPNAKWKDVYDDFQNGTAKIKIAVEPNLQSLKPWSHPGYPGFPLTTPDVYRAKLFIEELQKFEQKGDFPNLVYVYLPQDHTSGTAPGSPTPRAMVADNDLALGQIVEAISKSKFWAETCVIIVEDDPQSGYDHVDAHRTIALIASPYTRRKFVDHANYTQPGMVKTIELILGIPPMTQLDLSAPAMRTCFQTQADLTPYKFIPAKIAIDEMNPPLNKLKGAALKWAKKSMELSFAQADEADDDDLNEVLWHAMRGDGVPYPKEFAADDEH